MTRQRFVLHTAACSIAFLLLSASAWADITGTVWRVPGNLNDAGPGSESGGTMLGTFTASSINFDVPEGEGTNNPLSEFLAGAVLAPGFDATALGEVMSGPTTDNCYGSQTSSYPCYSTVIEITGTGEFVQGTTYEVTHDDGVTLAIGGVDAGLNAAGPVAQTETDFTFTGTTGNYSIDLWYMATNGNPEVLESDIVTTPEAGAISLLVTMLIGVAGFAGIFKKKLA